MTRFAFDCETDGLLDTLTRLHSLVLHDLDTGQIYSCTDHAYSAKDASIITTVRVNEALLMMMDADELVGHNIIKFDVKAIQKLFPWFRPRGLLLDTLVLSRLLWNDIADFDKFQVKHGYPSKLIGSHSLKAWGYRLKFYKGDFGETADWLHWSPDMQTYCEQDVAVTVKLYERIKLKTPTAKSIWVETEFAKVIAQQELNGFAFNVDEAVQLYSALVKRRFELMRELQTAFPPITKTEIFIPKVNNKTRGYVKGVPFEKQWTVEFNPSSRQMIAERLIAMGWQPDEFTPSGQAKIDETVLQKLPYPEAQVLAEHFLIEKRIGQLAEGEQAWLKLAKNGRIHGSVNTNGAVTGRCTHSRPNVAQVPKCGSPFGAECRALFGARKGWVLVGADLSGLELRCLAHFMALFDGGAYAEVVVNGDVHTLNQAAAGLPTRDNAKTFIYAFLYGAGDEKIGSIVNPNGTTEDQKSIGRKLKRAFLKKTPALRKLRELVQAKAEGRGHLIGLDGRILKVRSSHSALNLLLQSAGALISKAATIFAYQELLTRGYIDGKDFGFCAHVHDELQVECRPELAEEVGRILVDAFAKAGDYFDFKCPITGEFKIGQNWKETH